MAQVVVMSITAWKQVAWHAESLCKSADDVAKAAFTYVIFLNHSCEW